MSGDQQEIRVVAVEQVASRKASAYTEGDRAPQGHNDLARSQAGARGEALGDYVGDLGQGVGKWEQGRW